MTRSVTPTPMEGSLRTIHRLRRTGYALDSGRSGIAEAVVTSPFGSVAYGTHRGAVRREYLDYDLDEFTFRFNRRTSRYRGKLFYRLLQQAVGVDPVPCRQMVNHASD